MRCTLIIPNILENLLLTVWKLGNTLFICKLPRCQNTFSRFYDIIQLGILRVLINKLKEKRENYFYS